MRGRGWWRVVRRTAAVAAVLAAGAAIVGYAAARTAMHLMGPPPLAAVAPTSTIVLDREGRLLRAFTSTHGRWRLPVEPGEVDQRYLAMLFAFEDRRFRAHGGVDAVGIARAVWQAVTHGRLVSGGSTLTMQTARLVEARHDRTALGKLRQMVRAWQLEAQLSKDGILALYLRLAPFGGNIEGVRAASLAYFGKEPKRLSLGEAALLVALPQSPEARRPDRHAAAARAARDRVLDVAVARGVVAAAEAVRAKSEAVSSLRREFPKHAAHLAEAEVRRDPAAAVHLTTLDRPLQASLEELAETHVASLGHKLSAAILAVDHTSGEVLAYVGSAGYLDDARQGAIDMVQAVRSPGSTLKPFIYGLGFEQGVAHPETLIEDRPARFGTYAPKNFDEDFHGTVSVRAALAGSLNIPAVKMLDAVGPQRLVGRFRRAGLAPVLPQAAEPTLAVALGGIGFRLEDIAQMYAGLARGGEVKPLVWRRAAAIARTAGDGRPGLPPRRILDPVAAWYVADILKDAPPPPAAVGGRIAYKTGTSYGYRDAWAAGFDGRHTIVVWVGRPDGSSTLGLMGRTAAAPILFDAFQRLGPRRAGLATAPAGAVVTSGAGLPAPLKRFREAGAGEPSTSHAPPVLIAFPPDRAELEVEASGDPADPGQVLLKAEGGALPLTWLVDGAPLPSAPGAREAVWQPGGRGFVRLSVVDAEGRADRVTVRVKLPSP